MLSSPEPGRRAIHVPIHVPRTTARVRLVPDQQQRSRDPRHDLGKDGLARAERHAEVAGANLHEVTPKLFEERTVKPVPLADRSEVGRVGAVAGQDDGDVARRKVDEEEVEHDHNQRDRHELQHPKEKIPSHA